MSIAHSAFKGSFGELIVIDSGVFLSFGLRLLRHNRFDALDMSVGTLVVLSTIGWPLVIILPEKSFEIVSYRIDVTLWRRTVSCRLLI